MVAPKLLNIQFERHRVLFQLLVNTKMEKSGRRFGNRTGCQCNSTPGVNVMGYYPCVNSQMLYTECKYGGPLGRPGTKAWKRG